MNKYKLDTIDFEIRERNISTFLTVVYDFQSHQ